MSETDDLTGAERYLAERLADPEYRAAYEAAAPDYLTTRARRHAETHPESRDLTGAERYLAERLADPEYRAAYEAAAPAAGDGAGPSGPPWYLALDVWMALGGDSNAFEAWAHHEDDRRTWGDAWAQIVAAVGGSRMEGDTNPPPGTILDLPSYQWVRTG